MSSPDTDHKCLLIQPPEDVLKLKVDSGIFIDSRRKWYRFCMISTKHPETSTIYKSMSAIRYEEYKHMLSYPLMIHPFSLCCLYWEFWMFLVFLFNLLIMTGPASRAFTGKIQYVNYVRFVGDFLICIDIFKHFFTGYYSTTYATSVLDPSLVARRYLKFYFWVDVLSSMIVVIAPIHFYKPTRTTRTAMITVKFFGLLKILRMPRWSLAVELYRKYRNIRTYKLSIFKLCLIYLVLVSWLYTVVFYLMNNVNILYNVTSLPLEDLYLMATFYIMIVSFGEVTKQYLSEVSTGHILIATAAMCIGYCLQIYLIAKIMQIWIKFSSGQQKNKELLLQFQEYVKYKALPPELRERIFMYFDFKYQDEYFNEEKINDMAAVNLRKEMLLHMARRYMRRVKLLRIFPKEAIFRIMGKMKTEIYLPEDVLQKSCSPQQCMFFIYYGTVAVYSPSGKELCHLEDGAHFGDITLMFSEKRVATVIAVTACQVFRIRKADFMSILAPYPALRRKVDAIAYKRLLRTEQGKSW